MGWRGLVAVGTQTQKEVDPNKQTLFCYIEKYAKDVKQDQKIDQDLVESIMKGCGLMKEEIRRISMKTI